MLDVNVTTVKKAKLLINKERSQNRKSRKKSPIIEEYENYLTKLERGKAIAITLKSKDKYQTIKYRFNIAAKYLGIKNLKIERSGNKVICYREVRPRYRDTQAEAEIWSTNDDVIEEEYSTDFEHEATVETGPEIIDSADEQPEFTDVPDEEILVAQPDSIAAIEELMALEFDEELEVPMIHGDKTCETAAAMYGGTTFEAFEHQFVITKVEQLPLGEVQQKWFKQHGLFSPREFQEVWKQHHKGVFDPEQKVWLHHFRRGFPEPAEPDVNGFLDEDSE